VVRGVGGLAIGVWLVSHPVTQWFFFCWFWWCVCCCPAPPFVMFCLDIYFCVVAVLWSSGVFLILPSLNSFMTGGILKKKSHERRQGGDKRGK